VVSDKDKARKAVCHNPAKDERRAPAEVMNGVVEYDRIEREKKEEGKR
jgi:hypothetical protein